MTPKLQKLSGISEQEWWDRYGAINESLWHYNAYLHKHVRAPYLKEMYDFLYKADGHLLDFGCGTGWVSLVFAQKGMHVEGVDLSSEQIALAQKQAMDLSLNNANYSCSSMDAIVERGPFDSVLVHSLIHHLPETEKARLLTVISRSLTEGGRLFLYEPMAPSNKRPLAHLLFDKGMIVLFRLLRTILLYLKLYRPEIDLLERNGWKMVSPEEAPLLPEQLFRLIPPDLIITRFRYVQGYSTKYANLCMSLKPEARQILQRLIPIICWFDNLILTSPLRASLSVWPMTVCLLEKRTVKRT